MTSRAMPLQKENELDAISDLKDQVESCSALQMAGTSPGSSEGACKQNARPAVASSQGNGIGARMAENGGMSASVGAGSSTVSITYTAEQG